MIKGLGNDIIEIERIRGSIKEHGHHFLDRLFSKKEQEYCNRFADPATHFAGRFAAKEAIAKALGSGFGKELSWLDLEILNDAHGKPVVHAKRDGAILVSISHCQSYATAVAIAL